MKTNGLTDKEELFCVEYIDSLNATQAAIIAGYSAHSAASQASRLLRNVNIRARIEKLMDERSKRTLVHADFVVNSLVENVKRCQQAVPVMEFDPMEKRMVQKRDDEGNAVYEYDSTGANRALELLGKHLGIFEKDNSQSKAETVIKVGYGKEE